MKKLEIYYVSHHENGSRWTPLVKEMPFDGPMGEKELRETAERVATYGFWDGQYFVAPAAIMGVEVCDE